MKDNYILRALFDSDINEVLAIYNQHVKNSYAAYSEKELPVDFINKIKQDAISFYILEIMKKIIGFAVLRYYLPYDNFKHTGIFTYFLMPEYTQQGYGTILYNKLTEVAKKNGISKVFVHLSSLNIQSYNFHKKHGFEECGRFKDIAKKFNQVFDIIWMQKII